MVSSEYTKQYRLSNPNRVKIWATKAYQTSKRRAMLKITGGKDPICVNCGCNDVRLLEFNHIDGGGSKSIDFRYGSMSLIHDINKGRRKIDDLDIRCRICNSLHYLELRFGKLPFEIKYIIS